MTIELITQILTDVFVTTMMILLPILGASLVIGIMISIFQAATSIQEMTLTFVPKIVITSIVVIVMLPFIAEKLISLTTRLFQQFGSVLK
jgi:flagellar biosynthetic protein FliQ